MEKTPGSKPPASSRPPSSTQPPSSNSTEEHTSKEVPSEQTGDPLLIRSIRASSHLVKTDGSMPYGPANVLDGDPRSCWATVGTEEAPADWIEFEFDKPELIHSIQFSSGFFVPEYLEKNNRIRELDIEIDGSFHNRIVCTDPVTMGMSMTEILLHPEHSFTRIRFTVVSVYPGTRWNDSCISDVRFLRYGKVLHPGLVTEQTTEQTTEETTESATKASGEEINNITTKEAEQQDEPTGSVVSKKIRMYRLPGFIPYMKAESTQLSSPEDNSEDVVLDWEILSQLQRSESIEFTHSDDGLLVEEKNRYHDIKLSGRTIRYEYDEHRRLIRKITDYPEAAEGNRITTAEYLYDRDCLQEIQLSRGESRWRREYRYDLPESETERDVPQNPNMPAPLLNRCRHSEIRYYGSDGELNGTEIFEYNEAGQLKKMTASSNQTRSTTRYEYDSLGRIQKIFSGGWVEERIYAGDGRQLYVIIRDSSRPELTIRFRCFEYDSMGNLLKSTTYSCLREYDYVPGARTRWPDPRQRHRAARNTIHLAALGEGFTIQLTEDSRVQYAYDNNGTLRFALVDDHPGVEVP